MPAALPSRPIDATLSVTKAARLLGVHPNTVRAWSDAGRLRYYRINPRGDRRYRVGDLQRFLTAAENGPLESSAYALAPGRRTAERAQLGIAEPTIAAGTGAGESDRASSTVERDADLGLLVELGRIGRASCRERVCLHV